MVQQERQNLFADLARWGGNHQHEWMIMLLEARRVVPMRWTCGRIPGVSYELFVRSARSVVLATAIEVAIFFVVPLFAVATGAYPAMPIGVGTVSRILALFLPQALAVALPIAVPLTVFLVCRRTPITRRVLTTVGAFTIMCALVTAALNAWIAPEANAAYRKLAFGDTAGRIVNGRRLNEPGGAGDRFQMRQRWALPESVLMFAAFALAASRGEGAEVRRKKLR